MKRTVAQRKDRASYSAKREKIIKAAGPVLKRYGLSGTTIEAIAQEAGVDRVTIYYYFADKGAIFREAMADMILNGVMVGTTGRQSRTSAPGALRGNRDDPPGAEVDAWVKASARRRYLANMSCGAYTRAKELLGLGECEHRFGKGSWLLLRNVMPGAGRDTVFQVASEVRLPLAAVGGGDHPVGAACRRHGAHPLRNRVYRNYR